MPHYMYNDTVCFLDNTQIFIKKFILKLSFSTRIFLFILTSILSVVF